MSVLERTYQKGETIIKEGHLESSFFVIKEGRVEVVKRKGGGEVQLNILGAKDFFGELGLLDPDYDKHSATVRALERTKVIIMNRDDFDKYIGKLTPGTKNLLLTMARRLREADHRIALLKETDTGSGSSKVKGAQGG